MRMIIFLILSMASHLVFSEPMPANTATPINPQNTIYLSKDKADFNAGDANKTFDQLNLKLSTQNLILKDLLTAIKTLEQFNNSAQECIESSQKKLNNINNLLQIGQTTGVPNDKNNPASESHQNATTSSADQVYLQKEFKRISNQQAQCRLFTIRANEAINAYQSTAAELKKEETFSQSLPLWQVLPEFLEGWQNQNLFKNQIDIEISDFEWENWLYHFFLSLLISSYMLWKFLNVTKLKKNFYLKHDYIPWFMHLNLLIWMSLNWAWCILHPLTNQENFYTCALFKTFMLIFLSTFANYFLFSVKGIRALFHWYGLDFKYFHQLLLVIIYLCGAISLTHWVKILLEPSSATILTTQFSFMLITLLLSNYFVFKFIDRHFYYEWIQKHHKGLKTSGIVFSMACLVSSILGYHVLAMRMLSAALISLAIVFCASLLIHGTRKLYQVSLSGSWNVQIRYFFGYKEGQNHTELLILRLSTQLVIIGSSLYFIGQNLGYVSYYIDKLYAPLLNGVIFSNFTIYPARIIIGVMVFCVMFLICRALSTAITRYYQFEHEEDTQVAVASILNYIGFALALISGFLIAGFNFTGLAIVAGALSVGIGLGLQSIVNNFVSGLILLIEKPIKPGDRIIVDGVEGTVKKIRVRSTQIMTSAREDIILPNSDLITKRVTNYMYTDKYLSIGCQVQVAYDANIELVNELLLKAAFNHDDVIKTGKQKPHVLFKSFGEHALIFQLWCLIRDANKKSSVQSDLNYMILKLFKEHEIEMSFPQQTLIIQKSEDK